MIFITLSRITMSNPSLVSLLEELIHQDWQLNKEGNDWLITEDSQEATHTQVKIGGCRSLAFTLDVKNKNAWPFLNALEGVRSACDGIIVAEYKEQTFCLLLDMKSSASGTSKAIKQIRSNYLLMEWLIGLLQLHNHWNGQIIYSGIVSLKPRKTERKSTSKRPPLPNPQTFDSQPKHIFSLDNHPRITLSDIFNSLQKQIIL